MLRSASQASTRAWGWLAALRGGSTTSWSEWAADGDPSLPFFPAAQQLEALRRVNLAAGGRPVAASVVEALLTDGIPDRNRGDLRLSDEAGPDFGPPAVDPAGLPAADLLPVLTGPLARRLAHHPDPVPAQRPLPWRRGWSVAGDPWLAEHLHAVQLIQRRRPGSRTALLATDLPTMAVHAWADHAVSGGRLALHSWLRGRVGDGRMPRALDLAAQARQVAEQVGVRHTVLVLDPARLRGLPVPPAVDPAAIELARWVGRPLGLLVSPERRRSLLLHSLLPAATRRTAPITLPEPWQAALTTYAGAQRDRLRTGGYPVLGSLDALLPPGSLGSTGTTGATGPTAFPTDRVVLDRAIELLLGPAQWSGSSRSMEEAPR